jgi:hypothetical protein
VKRCFFGYGGAAYTQNFLAPTGTVLLLPRSITVGPNGAMLVTESMWKAYGRTCQGNLATFQIIGRPLTDELDGTQTFQFGSMVRDNTDPTSAAVSVYDASEALLCQFTGLKNWYTGACQDVTGDGLVSALDFFPFWTRAPLGLTEASPTFDDRYDLSLDGMISGLDYMALIGAFGKVCD